MKYDSGTGSEVRPDWFVLYHVERWVPNNNELNTFSVAKDYGYHKNAFTVDILKKLEETTKNGYIKITKVQVEQHV